MRPPFGFPHGRGGAGALATRSPWLEGVLPSGAMDRKLAWVGLNALPSLTPRRLRCLLSALGGPVEAWRAPRATWARVLGEEPAAKLDRERAQVDPEAELRAAGELGAKVLTWEEDGYPAPLRELAEPLGLGRPQSVGNLTRRVDLALHKSRKLRRTIKMIEAKIADQRSKTTGKSKRPVRPALHIQRPRGAPGLCRGVRDCRGEASGVQLCPMPGPRGVPVGAYSRRGPPGGSLPVPASQNSMSAFMTPSS